MDIFDRYAPLVQEFIYKKGWTALRQVQAQAGEILLDTDENLLVCSSTASGKTEAVFFPVFGTFIIRRLCTPVKKNLLTIGTECVIIHNM